MLRSLVVLDAFIKKKNIHGISSLKLHEAAQYVVGDAGGSFPLPGNLCHMTMTLFPNQRCFVYVLHVCVFNYHETTVMGFSRLAVLF